MSIAVDFRRHSAPADTDASKYAPRHANDDTADGHQDDHTSASERPRPKTWQRRARDAPDGRLPSGFLRAVPSDKEVESDDERAP